MTDDALRRALAALARTDSSNAETDDYSPTGDRRTFREVIERATAATGDLDEAAAFVEEVGLDELERAIERAERSVSACTADGQRALDAFREFREAAEGDHFHPGHGTSLGGGDIGPSK